MASVERDACSSKIEPIRDIQGGRTRVALLSLPFATAAKPSIQLGLLQAIASTHGFEAKCFHLGLEFAQQIGFPVYEALANHRGHLFGDWIFAAAAFGVDAPKRDFLGDFRTKIENLAGEFGTNPLNRLRSLREREVPLYLDRLLAQCAEHLSLLAAPSTLERVYDFDQDAFTQIIDTAQRSAPLLVLDMPHVWTGWSRATLTKADEVVVTATPELANLRNTKNLIDMLKRLRPNDPPPKLIINQAGVPKRPEIKPNDFSEPLGITPIAVIPFEPLLFGNAANNGRMLGEMDAAHPVTAIMNDIAHVLTGRSEVKAKKKAALGGLLGKLALKKKK